MLGILKLDTTRSGILEESKTHSMEGKHKQLGIFTSHNRN